MKKIIALVLAAMLLFSLAALAVDARSATETARALADESWVYLYTEKDGKNYEVHFLTEETGEEIEISVYADETKPIKIETENERLAGSAQNTLLDDAVRQTVSGEYPNAEIDSIISVKDDGLFEIHVYFTLFDRIGLLKLNAETGEIIKRKIFLTAPYDGWQTALNDDYGKDIAWSEGAPKAYETPNKDTANASFITLTEAKNAVTSRYPGARISEIELDFEGGKYVYEGEAYLNGREYDFRVDAVSGSLIKWKLDD